STVSLAMEGDERAFYDSVLSELRAAYKAMPEDDRNVLPLILVLREACSHPKAAFRTLRTMRDRGTISTLTEATLSSLGEAVRAIRPVKVDALVRHIKEAGDQSLIFTEFRTSQRELIDALEEAGLRTVAFHGSMSAEEKEEAVSTFKDGADAMVSTESGGEGRNLQFCRMVVNF